MPQENEIKLIALDLDGTLLNSQKELSPRNAAALTRAAAAGIEIVPCTGRFFGGMPEAVRELPFLHYAITVNGAQVYDIRGDCAIARTEIPLELALRIMEYLDTVPVAYDCFRENWGWMSRKFWDNIERYTSNPHYHAMVRSLRTPVPELKAWLRQECEKEEGRNTVGERCSIETTGEERRAGAVAEDSESMAGANRNRACPSGGETTKKERCVGAEAVDSESKVEANWSRAWAGSVEVTEKKLRAGAEARGSESMADANRNRACPSGGETTENERHVGAETQELIASGGSCENNAALHSGSPTAAGANRRGAVQKIQLFTTDFALRDRLLLELPGRFPETAVTSSFNNNIEINLASAHKGAALLQLADYLKIGREQTAAFGDGSNDVTLLRLAGLGVAMANACPAALAAADVVTEGCDEDGVAVVVEGLLASL